MLLFRLVIAAALVSHILRTDLGNTPSRLSGIFHIDSYLCGEVFKLDAQVFSREIILCHSLQLFTGFNHAEIN